MEAVMERWGAFSVIDHKNEIKLATELLLYDKIAVPTPTDRDGKDWKRWEQEGWEPEKLMNIIDRLKPARLVQEVEWDANREQSWRKKFEEAKAAIEKVNAVIQSEIDMHVADAQRDFAGRSKEELDQAIQRAAFSVTKTEIIKRSISGWRGRYLEGAGRVLCGLPVEGGFRPATSRRGCRPEGRRARQFPH
jgi:hypothetical protein